MHNTKITGFIALSAISAFLLILNFTPLAGGGVHPASRTSHGLGIGLPEGGPVFELTGADSVKRHGEAGAGTVFSIDMPITATLTGGDSGVECRAGGDSDGGGEGDYIIVLHFSNPLVSDQENATVTAHNPASGGGDVTAVSIDGNDLIVTLAGVTNAQVLTITATDVTDGTDTISSVDVNVGFLLGDTTGSRAVNASDIGQTKSKSGQTANPANFRTDVFVNDAINATDIGLVKDQSGTAVP